jgi:hypothetical protein
MQAGIDRLAAPLLVVLFSSLLNANGVSKRLGSGTCRSAATVAGRLALISHRTSRF